MAASPAARAAVRIPEPLAAVRHDVVHSLNPDFKAPPIDPATRRALADTTRAMLDLGSTTKVGEPKGGYNWFDYGTAAGARGLADSGNQGTHVAGTVAGPGSHTIGITPDVKFITSPKPADPPSTAVAAPVPSWATRNAGSGFAVPVVSGVVALMLQKHPDMTTPQVREALQGAGTPISATDAIAAADRVVAAATA